MKGWSAGRAVLLSSASGPPVCAATMGVDTSVDGHAYHAKSAGDYGAETTEGRPDSTCDSTRARATGW